MAETTTDSANSGAGFDLTQFYQVFFEEAGENLDRMEKQLLEIDITAADDEELNSIFRCAHSVKGGAATFGFADVAELTHQMETLLDKLRRHELEPTAPMVDVLLQSGDALRAQLARHQGAGGPAIDTTELLFSIRAMSAGEAPVVSAKPVAPAPAAPVAAAVAVAPPPVAHEPAPAEPASVAAPANVPGEARVLELRVGPLEHPEQANNLVELFQEITDLGTIEPIDGGQSSDGMRRFKVVTTSSDSDLLDLFTFHVAREAVVLLPLGKGYGFHAGAPGAPAESEAKPVELGYGFFDEAPGAPKGDAAPAVARSAYRGTGRQAQCRGQGRQGTRRHARIGHAARFDRKGRPAHQPGR